MKLSHYYIILDIYKSQLIYFIYAIIKKSLKRTVFCDFVQISVLILFCSIIYSYSYAGISSFTKLFVAHSNVDFYIQQS